MEAVPGCTGQGTVGRDYCAFDSAPETTNTNENLIGPGQDMKLLNTRRDECTEGNPCNECQGVSNCFGNPVVLFFIMSTCVQQYSDHYFCSFTPTTGL